MRRAFSPKWVQKEDGSTPLGINMGADFCAEHEWGIKELQRMFGMVTDDPTILGVERRIIRKLPEENIYFIDNKGVTILAVAHYYEPQTDIKKLKERWGEAKPYKLSKDEKVPLGVAWDERSFCIWATEEADRENLRHIQQALMSLDLLIGFGITNNPFENPGLTLVIASAMSEAARLDLFEKDFDHVTMRKKAEDTGIYKLLKDAGKTYYALSPRWKDDTIKGEIVWWLNPMEQQTYNYGWFGLDDLKAWAANEGPIIMKKKG